jgi:hypothetical protein
METISRIMTKPPVAWGPLRRMRLSRDQVSEISDKILYLDV